ncbi:MAG TPA: hypothetical protein VMN39_01290 [Longimicrobiaceae bacterium]|nr:hypothetical protein [Longimicrobiaceae bacterium]
MREWIAITFALGALSACEGDAVPAGPGEPVHDARQGVVVQVLAARDGKARGEAACDLLRSGVLTEVFGAGPEMATFRPGSRVVPHALCTVSWNSPGREELNVARREYVTRRMAATVRGQVFDEPMPPPSSYEISLTILNEAFASSSDAVVSLENAVAMLSEGVALTVAGGQHAARIDFDPWVEGVGDRAAWAPRLGELSVAIGGARYAVSARGFENPTRNRAAAIQLAKRLAERI